MITVLAGGDSFIWGSELADSPHGGEGGYSRNTFTALLSDNYICAAYPGNSNYDIAQELKRAILRYPGFPMVVVCWTWPSRDTILTSNRAVVEFQQFCEYHRIPYLCTCADNCLLEVLDHSKINWDNWFMFPPATEEWLTTEPRGFYQWAVENKYSCGSQRHPLEQAHKDAYLLIQDKFNEMVEKFVQQNCT